MPVHEQITTINPATELPIAAYDVSSSNQVEAALSAAELAAAEWRRVALTDRLELVKQLAAEIRSSVQSSAELITAEMGKPVSQARAEVEKCALGCDYYLEHAEQFLAHENIPTSASRSYVRYDPLGCVLAVMPWNFPYWQVFRFAVPTLLAGNVGLLKHASNVTGCALEIENIFERSGFPSGVFQTLVLPSRRIADLIADRRIAAVTLTGSEVAGKAVAEVAGRHLKKLVLELGGSDPFIVLDDADLDRVIPKAVQSRTMNCGQSCIAAKRFLVDNSQYDEFVERLSMQMQSLSIGDPLLEATDLGPMARDDLREELHQQVLGTVAQGGTLITGGHKPDRTGFFYEPTVLAHVRPEMTSFREELFGPVASVTRIADDNQAVQLANASQYGLGASIWTSDVERGERLAAAVDSGSVFVNDFTKSDPKVPFGGVKDSGYGRELSSFGMREFVNIKTVWID